MRTRVCAAASTHGSECGICLDAYACGDVVVRAGRGEGGAAGTTVRARGRSGVSRARTRSTADVWTRGCSQGGAPAPRAGATSASHTGRLP